MTVASQHYRDPATGQWLPVEAPPHLHPDAGPIEHGLLDGLDEDDHLQYARLVPSPGPSPRAGFLRYDVVDDAATLDVWDQPSGQYLGVGGPVGPTGPAGPQGPPGLDMPLAEADERYVNVDGDQMSGALGIVSADIPLTLDRIGGSESAIVLAADGTPRAQVRALATGGVRVTSGDAVSTHARLTPVGVELPSEPSLDAHATTKRYVDRVTKSIGLLGPNATFWRTIHRGGDPVVTPTSGKSEVAVSWPAVGGQFLRISPSLASTAAPGLVRVSLTVTTDVALDVVGTLVSQPDPLGPAADLDAAGVVATDWPGGSVAAGATERLTFDMQVPGDACSFRAFVSIEPVGTSAAQVVVRHLAMTWAAVGGGHLGEIRMFAIPALVPPGWLVLDGSAIPAQYPDLIAAIGPTLPNWDDRVPMGGGTPLAAGGANARTLVTANLPSHSHTITHDHPSVTSSSDSHSHTVAVKTGDNMGLDTHPHENNATQLAVGGGTQGTNTTRTTAGDSHAHTVDLPSFSGNSGSTGSGTALDTTPAHVRAVFAIYAGA